MTLLPSTVRLASPYPAAGVMVHTELMPLASGLVQTRVPLPPGTAEVML